MKAFIVVLSFILVATAKPQGYTYEKPSNYGLSVALLLPTLENQKIPTSFPALSTSHATQYSSSQSFSQDLSVANSHGSLGLGSQSNGGSLALGSSYSVGQGPLINTFNKNAFGGSTFGDTSNGVGPLSSSTFGSGSSFSGASVQAPVSNFVASPTINHFAQQSFAPATQPQAQAIIQKHIYVHVPPPEEEELNIPLPQSSVANRQKHYKIIFIKAPSAPSISQQLAQAQIAQQQSEEKTLVYVLVKKPESLEELQNSLSRAPLTQPSKPEVYFIKYKAQTVGGSAPPPIPQQIALTAPSASGAQLSDFELSGLTNLASSSVSTSSVAASSSSLGSAGAANVAAVIQPRTPAPEYGPPKH